MIAPEDIRAAVSEALAANETRCLDEEGDFREVLDEVTRSVVAVLDDGLDGPCSVCGREALVGQSVIATHPNPLRMWVVEACACGARRLAEHECPSEDEDGDVRVIAATPWRDR